MKTQTHTEYFLLKRMNHYLRQLTSVCSLVLVSVCFQACAGTNATTLETEIRHAGIFFEPLMWVGKAAPSAPENQALVDDIQKIKVHGWNTGADALEDFVAKHPDSSWNPALRANLGRYYFEHARYSEAIKNWEAAWAATKTAEHGPARQIADFTIAYWTKLLVGVGQVNEVRPLLNETSDRTFESATLRIMFNNTRRECKLMVNNTDVSFRCGAFALNDLFRAMKRPAMDISKIMTVPSPVTGFSLNKLVEIAGQAGAKLVAAEWGPSKTPVVPSVIHWKQDHYAAIVGERNGRYQVIDLAIGKPLWMSVADIRAEASGYFVIPKEKLPNDWKLLSAEEAGNIYGRGYVSGAPDGCDGCGNGSGGE